MKSLAYCFTMLSTLAISIATNQPTQAAQRARTFVSVNGNDSNPCSATQPCRTFQAAHDAVLAGGEIAVLDTGGYGTSGLPTSPLTINKAISIVAIGVEASIATASGQTAIIINAGSSDKVSLRGLTLDGQGVGGGGIFFIDGQSLTIEDCIVRNYNGNGLNFSSEATTTVTLVVSNSSFYDNHDSGILIETGSSGGTLSTEQDRMAMELLASPLLGQVVQAPLPSR